MTRKHFCTVLVSALFLAASCDRSEELPAAPVPFAEFVQRSKSLKEGDSLVANGVIDYKSICLNLLGNPRIEADICQVYLSENNHGGNVASVLLDLKFCGDDVASNCIELLPENAPPEVIVIRNTRYQRLKDGQISTVVIEKTSSRALPEIKQISSP